MRAAPVVSSALYGSQNEPSPFPAWMALWCLPTHTECWENGLAWQSGTDVAGWPLTIYTRLGTDVAGLAERRAVRQYMERIESSRRIGKEEDHFRAI